MTAILTGRPSLRAAAAANRTGDQTNALPPKPPPTCGPSTRTDAGSTSRAGATSAACAAGLWAPLLTGALADPTRR
nr:hypothetical protein [Actinophytocola sp.]